MSRSRRRSPIHGITTARSERWNKQDWHRRYRRRVRAAIARGDEVMPHFREVSNVWDFAKDGKAWWGYSPPEWYFEGRPWKAWVK